MANNTHAHTIRATHHQHHAQQPHPYNPNTDPTTPHARPTNIHHSQPPAIPQGNHKHAHPKTQGHSRTHRTPRNTHEIHPKNYQPSETSRTNSPHHPPQHSPTRHHGPQMGRQHRPTMVPHTTTPTTTGTLHHPPR